MSSEVHIYSISVCPFAQRSRIALRLKDVPFELTEIDVTESRPDWFLELNPLGQVPVIEHEGRVLNESSVINEYLDEVFPDPRVYPEDPYQRALSRILIDYGNNTFVPRMYEALMNQDQEKREECRERALEAWRWVDDFLNRYNPDGTYLSDEAGYGMAEVSFAPFFLRYCLLEYYLDFELPQTDEYERVARWRAACLDQPLVDETGMTEENFIKLYYDYSLGYGNGAVPEGRERSSFELSVPLDERPMPPKKFRD